MSDEEKATDPKPELSERLDSLVHELMRKANEDGIITDEEKAIVDGIKLTVQNFEDRMKLASTSDLFTDDELYELSYFQKAAVATAWHVASADRKLTDDEQILIKHLKLLLTEFDAPSK